jgi:cleavage and polyadenylation specificity factor subunit 2
MPFKYTAVTPKGTSNRTSILEFEGVKILADPGWDGTSDINYLNEIISSVDLILLSQPESSFLGAYAYLAFRDLKIPVYSTLPVCNLGRVATIDLYRSVGLIGPLEGTEYELNDVEEAFDKVITVKHSQNIDLRAKLDGLSITALNSGHSLGGTIWAINKNSEKIIYAPEWNHSKDSFLNGADLLQNATILRPSVFITSAKVGSILPHKKRVEKFFELVDATLGRGGTVLLPSSVGSRMLELIHLIDEHLQSAPIPVLLLSHAKARSLTYAGSMLEWMASGVIKDWESKGQVPFDASRVQVIDPTELHNLPGAKVVFCSGSGFEKSSISQTCLISLCSDEKTTIILTERSAQGTLGSELFDTWRENVENLQDGVPIALQKNLNLQVIREDFLLGDDLQEYENAVKKRREVKEQFKKQKKSTKSDIRFDDEDSDEEYESDIDDEEVLTNVKGTNNAIDAASKKEDKVPIDSNVKHLKGRFKMFPYIPKKAKSDDYGIVINPLDYTREEEKDVDRMKKKKDQLNKVKIGEKRKWNEGKKQDDVSDLDALFKPRSRTTTQINVSSRCVLSYVDLSGLVDLRSLSLIIPALKPKNVFLISDLTSSANLPKVGEVLKKHVSSRLEVFELENNETAQAVNTVQSFDIVLDESLSSQLKWQKIAGGFSVAHVIGEIKNKSEIKKEEEAELKEEGVDKIEEEEEDSKDVTSNDLVLVPLEKNSALLSNIRAIPLAIGDVRLSELKRTISALNYKVEFKGEGTLVVDDVVAIRKISDGDIVVDGVPGELFYKVKEEVRKMLAYV